jgi:hypothetical protein
MDLERLRAIIRDRWPDLWGVIGLTLAGIVGVYSGDLRHFWAGIILVVGVVVAGLLLTDFSPSGSERGPGRPRTSIDEKLTTVRRFNQVRPRYSNNADACNELGISTSTLHNYLRDLQRVRSQADEVLNDYDRL